MSSDAALEVHGVSKSYTIQHNTHGHVTLSQTLAHKVRHPMQRKEIETFWALRDVSFDVAKGEIFGIVGRNGAGKSTLLKLLSRVTPPTSGTIELNGRVGSLLEVGTGFHPELTGRENVYLNGSILGMRRKEIDAQFDAIVDFAGVENFLDTPVKRYSSGMYVRLAFAVAAHLDSDILIVDEVLAVGDMDFQRKCFGVMDGVARSGRTVLIVSHQMQVVASLCNRVLVLRNGAVDHLGPTGESLHHYLSHHTRVERDLRAEAPGRSGSGEMRIVEAATSEGVYQPDEAKQIRVRAEPTNDFNGTYFVALHVIDEMGTTVMHVDSRLQAEPLRAGQPNEVVVTISTPWLKPGDYAVDAYLVNLAGPLDYCPAAVQFKVDQQMPFRYPIGERAYESASVITNFDVTVVEPSTARSTRR